MAQNDGTERGHRRWAKIEGAERDLSTRSQIVSRYLQQGKELLFTFDSTQIRMRRHSSMGESKGFPHGNGPSHEFLVAVLCFIEFCAGCSTFAKPQHVRITQTVLEQGREEMCRRGCTLGRTRAPRERLMLD